MWQVTNSTDLSWNVISTSLGRLMLENTIALVFWGLKFTNNCLDHIDIDSKSLFITSSIVYGLWLEYEREVSSANSLVRLKRLSAISLTYNKKSRGQALNPVGLF